MKPLQKDEGETIGRGKAQGLSQKPANIRTDSEPVYQLKLFEEIGRGMLNPRNRFGFDDGLWTLNVHRSHCR